MAHCAWFRFRVSPARSREPTRRRDTNRTGCRDRGRASRRRRSASAVRRRSRSAQATSGRSHPGTRPSFLPVGAGDELRPDDLGPCSLEADRHRLQLQRYPEDALRLIERHHDGVKQVVLAAVRVHLGERTLVESDGHLLGVPGRRVVRGVPRDDVSGRGKERGRALPIQLVGVQVRDPSVRVDRERRLARIDERGESRAAAGVLADDSGAGGGRVSP